MNPDTMSLFEREMHDQVAAAREALRRARGKNDPLLVQAAEAHIEGLLDLARRNGIGDVSARDDELAREVVRVEPA